MSQGNETHEFEIWTHTQPLSMYSPSLLETSMTVAIPPCVIPVSVVGVGKGKECDCDSGASTKSRNEASESEAFLRRRLSKVRKNRIMLCSPDHVYAQHCSTSVFSHADTVPVLSPDLSSHLADFSDRLRLYCRRTALHEVARSVAYWSPRTTHCRPR